jgi:hypothetical protein
LAFEFGCCCTSHSALLMYINTLRCSMLVRLTQILKSSSLLFGRKSSTFSHSNSYFGGIFSVALSVSLRCPGVTWHCCPVESGLSSIILFVFLTWVLLRCVSFAPHYTKVTPVPIYATQSLLRLTGRISASYYDPLSGKEACSFYFRFAATRAVAPTSKILESTLRL